MLLAGFPARRSLLAAAALALATAAAPALAQGAGWPTRTVRILVGFPPGSTPDVVARILAENLAARLGHSVVVENKPGAAGNIAADQVAKAADDHTLGVVINGNLTSPEAAQPEAALRPGGTSACCRCWPQRRWCW
jgi:tripartite-type tricarboxylate transporter receptor subunit TctC